MRKITDAAYKADFLVGYGVRVIFCRSHHGAPRGENSQQRTPAPGE